MLDTLRFYIRSGKAGLYIHSYEEARVQDEITAVIDRLNSTADKASERFTLYVWSCTDGLIEVADPPKKFGDETRDPIAMLEQVDKLPERSIVMAMDYHGFLGTPNGCADPVLVRKTKDVLMSGKNANKVFVTCGCLLRLPPELEKEMAVIEFKLPDKEQLRVVLEKLAKSTGITLNGNTDPILEAASGLTTTEAEDAFALSLVEAGEIKPEIIAREKANTVRKNGILEIIENKFSIADIGGLEVLKDWLTKRRLAFTAKAKEFGLPIPKGVLALGIAGSGKSLTAKVTASIFNVPLLKLDVGKVFGSLVGASEANMRVVIQTAEAVSPCVLWCDEIEKGLSGTKSSGSTDGGTSARVFGTFLQWMQEKTAPVFVFATANDISQLPPEFLRKGRFDELFFVDLPDRAERSDIWRLHIAKKGRSPDDFNLDTLSDRTEGFTGAEIEAVVTEGLYAAFDDDTELQESHLLEAVRNTVPLSRTRAQEIEALRTWANGRARRASAVREPGATVGKTRKLA